jgi:hypothetical protein
MTELHPAVRSALDTLAPPFDDVPAAWDDALRRGAGPAARQLRWRAIAVAVAAGVLVGLAASPFGQAVVSDTLFELGAWLDDEPGEPASSEQQRAFETDNAVSYASFPTGTRVGVLLKSEFAGEEFILFGFRDGDALCLRLVPTRLRGERSVPAECVPWVELKRLDQPVVVLARNDLVANRGERCTTAVYGLATDRVEAVTIKRAAGAAKAAVGNNAFLSIADARDCRFHAAPTSVTASDAGGIRTTIQIRGFGERFLNRPEEDELPGPAEIDRRLEDGAVGWLERGDARGEAFDWPRPTSHAMLTSRVLRPNPAMSFRLGVGFARGDEHGDWYCLAHLWPLVKGPMSTMCARADWVRGGIGLAGAWPNETQFPLHVGLVADDVATLEVYYESGGRSSIPIVDNAFAFQAPFFEHVKLVARDAEGLVVKILVL